jgi:hypothetical protein
LDASRIASWLPAVAEARIFPPRGAHLVGSLPLDSAEDVFRAVAAPLGDRLRRIPDGETGERFLFAGWQVKTFQRHPDFERAPGRRVMEVVTPHRLRKGVNAASVSFDDLGFAGAAIDSYNVFARLRSDGVIPHGVRFQVSLPTPVNCLAQVVDKRDIANVEPAYEAALLREVDRIAAAIPQSELAIQWDCPWEVRVWDGHLPRFLVQPWFPDAHLGILDRLSRLGERVPPGVELGYHMCHGDYEHTGNLIFRMRGEPKSAMARAALSRMLRQAMVVVAGPPRDMRTVVEMTNAIVSRLSRPVDFVHLPVPRKTDARYFAPLHDLSVAAETEVYLGLVHYTDGVPGTLRRIARARALGREFGVATECGWGRRVRSTIPGLIDLHRRMSTPSR